jgi:hypothetical protein
MKENFIAQQHACRFTVFAVSPASEANCWSSLEPHRRTGHWEKHFEKLSLRNSILAIRNIP